MRIEVMTFACRLGHPDCINESIEQFKKWMNENDPDKINKYLLHHLINIYFQ